MTTQNIFNLVDTWASGGGPYTSIKMNATDNDPASASLLMDLQVGGASKFSVSKSGTITAIAGSATTGSQGITFAGNTIAGLYAASSQLYLSGNAINVTSQLMVTNNVNITNDAAGLRLGASNDAILTRRAAANLRLGNVDAAAPVAQTLSVQSVVAGTTNTAGTNLTITGSQGTGTGAGGSIIFQVAPAGSSGSAQNGLATALTINADKSATFAGAINMGGVSLSTSGNTFVFTNNGSGQALTLGIATNTLMFGGITSSFPALKRSSTTLQARLADDSAFASVQGKLTTETAYTAGAPTATGYLVIYDSNGTAYRVPAVLN